MAPLLKIDRIIILPGGIKLGKRFVPRSGIYSASVIDRRRLPLGCFLVASLAGIFMGLAGWKESVATTFFASGMVGVLACLSIPATWTVHLATSHGRLRVFCSRDRRKAQDLAELLLKASKRVS